MAGLIPRHFIDDLLARLDIIDIIDARVKLKKKGKNYSACCPFHNEKSPSFSVSQEKQFYHCFGCGVHGNAIDFLMEFERLEFPEAIEELASLAGVEVIREQSTQGHYQATNSEQKGTDKQSIYELLQKSAQFYQSALKDPANVQAIDYLKHRGLTGETAKKFAIGYAPDLWDGLKNKLGHNSNALQSLTDAGMLIEKDNGHHYDRFRGRVMFPIRDKRGRVIGFGGRVLNDGTPKYLNSPETSVFHKGKELYGLYELLNANKTPEKVLITEGYMDVVALAQYGIDYAVGTLGTASSTEHLQTLFRLTDTVVCVFDGDKAGRKAARRAMENALSSLNANKILKVLFLPDGEDPDTYVQTHGKAAFEQAIDNADSLIDFLLAEIKKEAPDDNSKRWGTYVVTHTAPLLNQIQDASLKAYLWRELTKVTGWNDFALEKFINSLINKSPDTNEPKTLQNQEIKRTPMRVTLALLIQNPNYAQFVPDLSSEKELNLPGFDLLIDILDYCKNRPHINTGQLLEQWRDDDRSQVIFRLATWDIPLNQEHPEEVFLDSVDKILTQCVEIRIDHLVTKSRIHGLSAEEKMHLQCLMADLKN